MKKIDKDGLILCDIQAKAFEISITAMNTSSEIFVRRFMNSKIAKEMDNLSVLQDNLQAKDILDRIDEEYGKSDYGSVKYTKNEMYWIGYLYRYFAYTYNMSSIQVYKIVKPKELRGLFLPYHTMDTAQAIDRIIEAKGIAIDSADEEKRQEIIDALDEQFKQVNEKYFKYRRWGMLNRPEVLLLKEKTYWDYREFLRNKGVVLNQIKPVTVINSKERRDFFFSHVITENSSAVESWKNTEEIE